MQPRKRPTLAHMQAQASKQNSVQEAGWAWAVAQHLFRNACVLVRIRLGGEKEKRKLVKVLDELDHARVYIDIVNDPGLKKEILEHYIVTEAKYYELLAYFNEHNSAIIHSGNPETILNALNNYFKSSLKAR